MQFTTVKRAIRAVMLDGDDVDQVPEVRQVQGQVTFTPVLGAGDSVQVETVEGPVTVVLSPVTVRVSDGVVMHRGSVGVQLFAGGEGSNPPLIRWRASFSGLQAQGVPLALRDVVFDAVPGGEVDLTNVAPLANLVEPVVRGPQGTSIGRITVEGGDLVVWGRIESGAEVRLSTIPMRELTEGAAEDAALVALNSTRSTLEGFVSQASASAAAAKSSETAAAGSASAAASSASSALASKNSAASSASSATSSKNAAATSATNAAGSATTAEHWAAHSLASKNSAATSATNAANSATAAAGSASSAKADADRAAAEALKATGLPLSEVSADVKPGTVPRRTTSGTINAADPLNPAEVATKGYTDGKLANKADLVGGLVPTSQLPAVALTKPHVVASRAAMLALPAQEGDVAVITSGADKGTYMLGTGSPSVFTSWVMLVAPTDVVTSVNGQIGAVNLTAANVGAAPSAHTHTMSQVTDLPALETPIREAYDRANKIAVRDSKGRLLSQNYASAAEVLATETELPHTLASLWAARQVAGDVLAKSTIPQSQVVGLQSALDGKAAASHTHTTAQVTGLDTALAGKAAASHTHTIANVTGLQSALDGKANTATVSQRPALFSGAGAPPASIPGAVVGDWWLDTDTKNLYIITGV
ncbi:hypothetical protein [Corynebacterium liangguodongii]|uniref:Uncharacterized protein n=1 Tax=Corynebacterium liangguodongii TaxID=2079535 RepID=A0A2S0WG62_9CORY|nr:hypothetical protein [Corynebacterium liangguodongii]AWB84761.1 hypothetical protein C3E79_09995 [Corynebacterium liangguodongii]PWB99119.1 hypothetical protein DF219_07610 [Corynebacterium liangguodongii]